MCAYVYVWATHVGFDSSGVCLQELVTPTSDRTRRATKFHRNSQERVAHRIKIKHATTTRGYICNFIHVYILML